MERMLIFSHSSNLLQLIAVAILILFFELPVEGKDLKVLFIGNSYTYVNDLPGMTQALARSGGDSLYYDVNTPGGYTLEAHSQDASTINKIFSQAWDVVVLQEQSQRPAFPPAQVAINVYPYARKLDSLIKANRFCTETVFYMSWGRKYGDETNCPTYPNFCTYAKMQQRLRESYLQMGQDLSAAVAPVGIAWKHSMEGDSTVDLYSGDNSHPSEYGTYLAACVFYATLFQKSPVGLSYTATLPAAAARRLQQIAASTVFDSVTLWNINARHPHAEFSFTQSQDSVRFINTSSKATIYHWEFGNGDTSAIAAPVYVYHANGTYQVTLIASSPCASDTFINTVTIGPVNVEEKSYRTIPHFFFYPSPGSGDITITTDQEVRESYLITLNDVLGRTISTITFPAGSSHVTIPVAIFSGVHGLCFARWSQGGTTITKKILRQ